MGMAVAVGSPLLFGLVTYRLLECLRIGKCHNRFFGVVYDDWYG